MDKRNLRVSARLIDQMKKLVWSCPINYGHEVTMTSGAFLKMCQAVQSNNWAGGENHYSKGWVKIDNSCCKKCKTAAVVQPYWQEVEDGGKAEEVKFVACALRPKAITLVSQAAAECLVNDISSSEPRFTG